MRGPSGRKDGGGQRASFAEAGPDLPGPARTTAGKSVVFQDLAPGMALAQSRKPPDRGFVRSYWGFAPMVFAGLAASAAVDLLSLLQPAKPKSGGTGVTKSAFKLPDAQGTAATSTQSQSETAISQTDASQAARKGGMDTLLSAQGQAQAHHKKRSMGVLLDLMKSSQDGSVTKSDFETALGGDDKKASDMFDRIDQNHDSTVNASELSAYMDTYRRNAEAGTTGKGRALAVAA